MTVRERRFIHAPSAFAGALIVLVLLGVLAVPEAHADTGFAWQIALIQSDVGIGGATSIVLDSNGYPRLAYADTDTGRVQYVRWTGESWDANPAPQSGYAYGPVSLALDVKDRPHIAFFDAQAGRIKYANLGDFGWRVLAVDDGLYVGHLSIAIDADGNPHIAYPWDNGRLRHARLQGSTWTMETVDPDSVIARYPSIVIDALGHPNIAYYAKGNLYRAQWIGYRWNIEAVENASNPQFVTLRLDPNGIPKIGYRSSQANELRYVTWNGSAWLRETVDAAGDPGWDARLALDASGEPHFSYYERTEGVLKYARKLGGSWIIHVVDFSRVSGWWSDLAIGTDGRPHFSYYSWGDHSVRYAVGGYALGIRLWPARDLAPTSATLRAELMSLGTAPQAIVAIEWRIAGGEWSRLHETTLTAPGMVITTVTGLAPKTAYEARALAVVDAAVTHGNTQNFTTPEAPPALSLPVETVAALGGLSAIVVAVAAYFVLQRRRKEKK